MIKEYIFPYKIFIFLLVSITISAQDWGVIRYVHTKTNIREMRTTASRIVGQLKRGQTIKADFLKDNWYAVFKAAEYNRDENKAIGYIYAPLLRSEPPFDFRKTRWGMSITQVGKAEVKKFEYVDTLGIRKFQYLGCSDKIAGISCGVNYTFVYKKLARGRITFIEMHKDLNEFIEDYKKVKTYLIKKYGNPIQPKHSERVWLNDRYKYNPKYWGRAVLEGDLVYGIKWENPYTEMWLILAGGNNHISVVVIYICKELEHLLEDEVRPMY